MTIIITMGRAKYVWITFTPPLCFVSAPTLTAGFMTVRDNFWPLTSSPNLALQVQGYVDSTCTVIMMICVVIILAAAARRWMLVFSGRAPAVALAEG